MTAVGLFRARHRGTEGAGVAVSWERVEDVRDLDGAMDAITERGDGWMCRLVEDGRRSVWGVVAGQPVEVTAPSWLSRDDVGLKRGERDWIDALGTLCGAPVPFVVEALFMSDRRTGVDIALHMTLCAWQCAEGNPPGEHVLRGIDAWRREDVPAASLRDRVERLRTQITPSATGGMPYAVREAGRSVFELAQSILADEPREAGVTSFWQSGLLESPSDSPRGRPMARTRSTGWCASASRPRCCSTSSGRVSPPPRSEPAGDLRPKSIRETVSRLILSAYLRDCPVAADGGEVEHHRRPHSFCGQERA